jgi:DNA polymerase-1
VINKLKKSIISNDKDLQLLEDELSSYTTYCFDTETTNDQGDGLAFNRYMFGCSIAVKHNDRWKGYYISVRHKSNNQISLFDNNQCDNCTPTKVVATIQKLLSNKNVIIHNSQFERGVFKNEGIDYSTFNIIDTLPLAWLLDPERDGGNGLKNLVKQQLKYKMTEFSAFKEFKDASLAPQSTMGLYAIDDVVQLGKLYDKLYPILLKDSRMSKIYHEIYLELVGIAFQMHYTGIEVDTEKLRSLAHIWKNEIQTIEINIKDAIKPSLNGSDISVDKLNLGSSKQLSELFIDTLCLWQPLEDDRGGNGSWSTATDNLKTWSKSKSTPLGKEIATNILRHREISKLLGTYAEPLAQLGEQDVNRRVHCSLNPMGTATGRFSCSYPNLQTIPSKSKDGKIIRECFIAKKGYKLIGCDYSQIELRLLAHFTKAKALVDAYHDGKDVHSATASSIFQIPIDQVDEQKRRIGKGINFALIYGQGANALAESVGVSLSDAKLFIQRYFDNVQGVREWKAGYIEECRSNLSTKTILGRTRLLPEFSTKDRELIARAERISVNTRIQGSAADLCNLAIRNFFRKLNEQNLDAKLLLQVHDEIVVECREDIVEYVKDLLVDTMQSVVKLEVPLIADPAIGNNLRETK